jgi:hypothetical protein
MQPGGILNGATNDGAGCQLHPTLDGAIVSQAATENQRQSTRDGRPSARQEVEDLPLASPSSYYCYNYLQEGQ